MKWKTKVPPQFLICSERTVRKFALFPERLSDGFTVWLQFYTEHQKFWPQNAGYDLDFDGEELRKRFNDPESDLYQDDFFWYWMAYKTTS